MRNRIRSVARVAYTFVLMNYAAVAGLFAARRGSEVWRPVIGSRETAEHSRETGEPIHGIGRPMRWR